MEKTKITEPGCFGLLLLVGPFIADAISPSLVLPTILVSIAAVIIAFVFTEVPWKKLAAPIANAKERSRKAAMDARRLQAEQKDREERENRALAAAQVAKEKQDKEAARLQSERREKMAVREEAERWYRDHATLLAPHFPTHLFRVVLRIDLADDKTVPEMLAALRKLMQKWQPVLAKEHENQKQREAHRAENLARLRTLDAEIEQLRSKLLDLDRVKTATDQDTADVIEDEKNGVRQEIARLQAQRTLLLDRGEGAVA